MLNKSTLTAILAPIGDITVKTEQIITREIEPRSYCNSEIISKTAKIISKVLVNTLHLDPHYPVLRTILAELGLKF
jgi:hypothetical protein